MYKNPYIKIQPKTKSPYTEIYLIRHCNPDYSLKRKVGEDNMPLSKLGKKQRGYLTKKLLTLDINVVYSSELVRAQETAKLFLNKIRKEALIDPGLNEIDWVDWYQVKYFNMTEEERKRKFKDYHKLDLRLNKLQDKARKALAAIYKSNQGKKIAIFSHGNLIRALLTDILDADIIGFLSFDIFQSSISKLVIDKNGYVKIVSVNNVDHLPQAPLRDKYITLIEDD